ncbi:amidohydrolase family protein [Chitinophaga sp. S165]|uniref:amidohydrolase family protein n=1 Tax=Chitinophaga sp. S165 TaxID=2135462 RepID=UPI000D70BDC8|nr:amidohydrolase family protein [Chitinophaga sp. S165]PWV56195.1 amidohydrolase family protein [Chitinophaga sp. S165]
MQDEKHPIINCHTHVFTGDHVPPFLARTFVPEPLHYLISLKLIVGFFRWWYRGPARIPYTYWFKKLRRGFTAVNRVYNKCWPFNTIFEYYLFFQTLYLLNELLPAVLPEGNWLSSLTDQLYAWLAPFMLPIKGTFLQGCFVVFVLLFFPSIRNLVIWMSSGLKKFVAMLPGKQTREMIGRYVNIGRYAFHRQQSRIFSKLKSQYPEGTGFVVLPMDMDYMAAGESRVRYRDQMQELAEMKEKKRNKKTFFPFVFVDPRRCVPVAEEKRSVKGDKPFFEWRQEGDKVVLEDCFIREYLEERQFSGIKIYPALGYFPFDIKLLPLWKYAADNNIPILTHCIRGTIFYRGRKKTEWYEHPVFEQAMGGESDDNEDVKDGFETDEQRETHDSLKSEYVPLVLSQTKNMDFSCNFTHPMNFLCLLDKGQLQKLLGGDVLKKVSSQEEIARVKALFGYSDTGLTQDLSALKICLGHFGGDDEWCRYFEKDRYNYSSQLIKHPDEGIQFFTRLDGEPSPGKPEQIWRYTDWYSIICSMMLQYKNVYADISYILHNDAAILPLLKETLQNKRLREKVLYGTDFFVVRNHKSDKNMVADMMGGLSEEDFDQIARINPRKYLNIKDNPRTVVIYSNPDNEGIPGVDGEKLNDEVPVSKYDIDTSPIDC